MDRRVSHSCGSTRAGMTRTAMENTRAGVGCLATLQNGMNDDHVFSVESCCVPEPMTG